MSSRRSGRRLAALLALVVALGLATAIALVAGLRSGPSDEVAPPVGAALRLGGLARDITVGLAARADSIEVTVLAPDATSPANATAAEGVVRLTLKGPGRPVVVLPTRLCGPACHVASARLRPGVSRIEVQILRDQRSPASAAFRVPWPLGPPADALLRRAVAAMGRLAAVRVQERSTSDSALPLSPSPTLRLSGRQLLNAATYAPEGAQDARQLPDVRGFRVLAYALPGASVWYELWIGKDGLIHRERLTTPNHLILHRFSEFRFPDVRLRPT